MKYVSASEILPEYLLHEIQKYVHGSVLYIPSPEEAQKKVGADFGAERVSAEAKFRD